MGSGRQRCWGVHWALLTILANWVTKGLPEPSYVGADDYQMNSQYRAWIAAVGGAIEAAGFDGIGPLLSNRDLLEESNHEGAEDERMLRILREVFGTSDFTFIHIANLMNDYSRDNTGGRELLRSAFPLAVVDRWNKGQMAPLEMHLASKRGAPFGDDNIRLEWRRDKDKHLFYKVVTD